MRIACVHVPQFGLQCATRLDPSLRGMPVVVVGAGVENAGPLHAPLVLACSRAAWALGIRVGMTATGARSLGNVEVVPIDAATEREGVRALADALLGLTGVVDLGGRVGIGGAHLAMYAEVPVKTRGTSFGDKIVELAAELGFEVRVGISDDRFTAWVAAAHGHGDDTAVLSVPRGGAAAFLAPRPLSLLAISPEVQHMLEALGVHTLGEFAALPAPSVSRPFEADYQALARGDGGTALRPYAPDAAIREEIVISSGNVLDGPTSGAISGPGAVALAARRIALRLHGRGRAAARVEVAVDGGKAAIEHVLVQPITEPEQLARVVAPAIESAPAGRWRLRVEVTGEVVAGQVAAAPSVYAAPDLAPVRAPIDPLTVVLSTSGSLFALAAQSQSPRAEHRRIRRGKQRRSRPVLAARAIAQARLFERG